MRRPHDADPDCRTFTTDSTDDWRMRRHHGGAVSENLPPRDQNFGDRAPPRHRSGRPLPSSLSSLIDRTSILFSIYRATFPLGDENCLTVLSAGASGQIGKLSLIVLLTTLKHCCRSARSLCTIVLARLSTIVLRSRKFDI